MSSVPTSKIPGFRALNLETVKDYVAERPDLGERVGPSGSKDSWTVRLQLCLLLCLEGFNQSRNAASCVMLSAC